MSSIKFNCPSCNQRIEARLNHAGIHAKCPTCNKPLRVPEITQRGEDGEGEKTNVNYNTSQGTPEKDTINVKEGGFLTKIFSKINKTPNNPKNPENDPSRGISHFRMGMSHYKNQCWQKALDCFDIAIESGVENGDVYSARASCLEALNWHLDAIDDFDKAILHEPNDCNHYYQRANCKFDIGDRHGFLVDIQKAINLSREDTELNNIYNIGAKNMGGWTNVTEMYISHSLLTITVSESEIRNSAERSRLRGKRNRPTGQP